MPISASPPAEKGGRFLRIWNPAACSPRIPFSLPLVVVVSVCLLTESKGASILWGSRGYVENADSKGRSWGPDYTMVIGVFRSGFSPSYENREQWIMEWQELGTATYDTEEKRFAGTVDTDAFTTIPTGTKIYFWARNGNDLTKGPEWVLLTEDSWKWPAKSSTVAPAITWTTNEESITLVVGDAGKNGAHLISRTLRPVPVPESTWLAEHFGNRVQDMDANADPDGDGLSNALEYLLGSNPTDASSKVTPTMATGGSTVRLNLARNPYAESGYILEASEDLKAWFKVDHDLLTDRPDLLETSVPADPSKPRLFFRFQLKSVAQ